MQLCVVESHSRRSMHNRECSQVRMVDTIIQPGCAECGAGGLVLTDYRPYAFLRALLHIDLSCLHSVVQLTLPVEIAIFDCFIALIRTIYVPVASCSSWKTLTITTGEVTSTGIHIRTLGVCC